VELRASLASVQKDRRSVVTDPIAGNFSGSPIDLQFVLTVEAGDVASLEIH
jgi:hypothetical protein